MIDRLPANLKVEERDLMPPALWRRFKEVGPQTDVFDPLVICRYYSHYGQYNWFGIDFHQSIYNYFWGFVLFPTTFRWCQYNFDTLTRLKEVHYEVRLDTDFVERPVSEVMEDIDLGDVDYSRANAAHGRLLRLAIKRLDEISL